MSAEVRTWYDRNLLARLLPRLVYMSFGQVRPMPSREGQTVNFRRFDSLPVATTALVEGITPGNETPTISQITASPAQYGSWVEVTDILDFTAPDPVLTEFTQLLAEQAAQTMDILTRDIVVAGTNVQYAGTAHTLRNQVAATDVLNTVEIRRAVRTMQNNKVGKLTGILNSSTGVGTKPINAAYIGIIGPSALYDLKSATQFVSVESYGSSAGGTLPYEVGALDDVRFVLSNNPKIYTGAGAAGADVHASLIVGADAFGMISPMGIANIIKGFGVNGNDPLDQRATTGWKAYYTAVILQQLAILRIEHGVSA
jgi:N4-gp56 family major capsid protein